MATADYLAFLDSDDCWVPEKLEMQEKVLKKIPGLICCVEEWKKDLLKFYFIKIMYYITYHWKNTAQKRYIYFNSCDSSIKSKGCRIFWWVYAVLWRYELLPAFFEWNQVYYLPKKLVDYGIGRKYYGQSGLSSHLKEMHCGRKRNFQILRRKRFLYILYCDDCIWWN